MDAQHKELLRIFLLRHPAIIEVSQPYYADVIAVHPLELLNGKPKQGSIKHYVVLDFGDLYMRKGGVRHEDGEYRQAVRDAGLTYIYLQSEPNPSMPVAKYGDMPIFKRIYMEDDPNFIQLSIPLGYCSGAKMNLSYPDMDKSAYFVDNFEKNPKEYTSNFCWIGAESSQDRTIMMKKVYWVYHRNGLFTNIINQELEIDNKNGLNLYTDFIELPDGKLNPSIPKPYKEYGMLIKSEMPKSNTFQERLKELNADNKTVSYDKYLRWHKQSKVNISCNGFSMWNYMDGEYFSRNCFNLRQYHNGLTRNPYSPKDGTHWVIFKNDELIDKIEYYVEHDEERERINDAGFEYFKESICGGWAKIYGDMLLDYMNTGKRTVFDKVRLVTRN